MDIQLRRSLLLLFLFLSLPLQAAEIHEAIKKGSRVKVEACLNADPACIEARDETGQTPLHVAAANRQSRLVQLLLDRRAAVDPEDEQGRTPLALAVQSGDLSSVEMLLARNADINVTVEGNSLLHLAVADGSRGMVSRLIDGGIDLNRVSDTLGTPLQVAAASGSGEMVFLLLLAQARIDAVDNQGQSALHRAAQSGQLAVAKLLVREGADHGLTDNQGRTARDLAVQAGHAEVAEFLADPPAAQPKHNQVEINM